MFIFQSSRKITERIFRHVKTHLSRCSTLTCTSNRTIFKEPEAAPCMRAVSPLALGRLTCFQNHARGTINARATHVGHLTLPGLPSGNVHFPVDDAGKGKGHLREQKAPANDAVECRDSHQGALHSMILNSTCATKRLRMSWAEEEQWCSHPCRRTRHIVYVTKKYRTYSTTDTDTNTKAAAAAMTTVSDNARTIRELCGRYGAWLLSRNSVFIT